MRSGAATRVIPDAAARGISGASGRTARSSVPDGSGGLYITWADHRDGNWDIYLLRVTSTGAVVSGWPTVGLAVCTAPGDQIESIVLPDGSNGALVGWVDYRDSWNIPDLYAQRVDLAGAPQWTPNGVKVLATTLPDGVGVAPDGTGGLLLAWSETGAVDEDIYATRYTSTGGLATGWPVLVCDSAEDQVRPVITEGAGGGAILAWEDGRAGSGQTNVFAQRLDGAGAAQWAPGGLQIDDSLLGPFEPDICPATGGGAFVFWTDLDGMVYGQRLNSAGQGQWTGAVNAGGASIADGSLLIAPDGVDGVIAAWHEASGVDEGIRAQRVSGTGTRLWANDGVSVMTAVTAFPLLFHIVADGGAYFVWEDSRNGFDDLDIYGQRVTAAGVPSWGDSGIAICDASGFQSIPAAAYSVSGDLLVAWADMRFTDTDIYAQRVSAVGADQLADNGVAVFSDPGVQFGPPIFHTGDGGTIAFWHEKRNGQYDIRARKFDASSLPAGPAVDVCSAPGNQFMSALADDGSGGAIVSWTDLRGAAEDIYVQRVDGNAIPQWTTNGVAVCTAAGRQQFAGMVTDMAGGAILAWQDDREPSNPDIYVQRVNAAGTPVWTPTNGKVVCADPGSQFGAVLASDGASGAVIAWTDYRNFVSPAIYAQRVDDTGLPLWTADGRNIASFGGPLAFPVVSRAVPGPANTAIVLINVLGFDLITGTPTNALHAQKVNASGDPQWGLSAPVCDVSSQCANEQIVEDGSGGAYVAWSDGRNDVYDIYLQRLDPTTGSGLLALNGKAVCDAAGWQDLGAITRDSGGNVILIWSDERSGQPDIYVHRVDASGNDVWDADGKVVCNLSRGQYFGVIAPWKSAVPERFYVGWTDNRAGDARYVHLQRLDSNGAPQWTPNGVTRTELALVQAEANAERVRLEWYASESVVATVYRLAPDRDWTAIGSVLSDGAGRIVFEDPDISTGSRYGYRLGIQESGGETFHGEVWVEIPLGLEFALEGLRPNPAHQDLLVSFALANGERARLELLDVSGRLVRQRDLVGLAPGRHTVRLDGSRPPAGVYFLRLTQERRSLTARAIVLD